LESFQFKEEVRDAIDEDRPVVALESTIIAHGMPYPENVETALKVEEIVRSAGAVPATIGVLNGEIKVGLSEEEIGQLAEAEEVVKVSRRDFPVVLARGQHGATTVAGTTIVAEKAGIKVFVTGGVGGVHRGEGQVFDVSADIRQVSLSNVAVVSAGVKSILNIGATLEKLETYGVPVLGYGTDEFPAFYSRESGFQVDYRVDSPEEIGKVLLSRWDMGLDGGALIANPVPRKDEITSEVMSEIIDEVVEEAEQKKVSGKRLTPFLLDRIVEKSGGDSLEANIALVKNNAELGGKIARQVVAN
jgi:pseudouridine-5'-phosphate glycosidase